MAKMKNIKIILKNQGKTQSWLADELGLGGSFLNTVITGRRKKPTEPRLLRQIAFVLGVDLSVLRNNETVKLVSKICPGCGQVKPLESFGINKILNCGHTSYCRECASLIARTWQGYHPGYLPKYRQRRRENPDLREKDRAAARVWTKKNPDKAAAYKRAHNLRHPDRAKARNRITSLLSRGKIIKPTACKKCGKSGPVEAHHPDYRKPLYVIWICKPCHLQAHGKLSRKIKKGY